MEEIVIVHLSDIHFAEKDFWEGMTEVQNMPLRDRHNTNALIALDKKLKQIEYDLLVVSGDLSRAGHQDSFSYAKNWLYGEIKAPNGNKIGLKHAEDDKTCFVVPGNHDSFDGGAWQNSLNNYHRFFPQINGAALATTVVKGIPVNIHLYDSTYSKGGFAKGHIPPANFLRIETSDETLDVVVVHHHVAQHPSQERDHSLEMVNVDEFLSFLLSQNNNAILFGHTHARFFEKISADMLKSQLQYKRKFGRVLRMLPKRWYSPSIDSLSFKRVPTKGGKFPRLDKHFEYLYLKNIKKEKEVLGPEKFKTPRHFYSHIESYRSDYGTQIEEMKKRKVAFSMAPSACYPNEESNGFHVLTFKKDQGRFIYGCKYYEWDGSDFNLKS